MNRFGCSFLLFWGLICNLLPVFADDDLVLLEDLIRIPSVSTDVTNVNRVVRFLEKRLTDEGLFCRVETTAEGRDVLFAANVLTHSPDVLFSAHLDVAPAQTPSMFVPRRENGRIYGRGASDCKEHCVLAIRLMRELKGRVSVGCLFGSDEEIGGSTTAWMLTCGYGANRLVVVLDSEQYAITTRQKGLGDYIVMRSAPAVHTGLVGGVPPNAVVSLLRGYCAMTDVLPETEDGSWRDTVTCESVSGGRERAEMRLRLRCATVGGWNRLEKLLKTKLGGEVHCLYRTEAVLLNESDAKLLDFRERMRLKWPSRTIDFYHLNSCTDASHLQRLKKPMLILGVDARGAHTDGEYVICRSLDEYAELLREYLLTLCLN